jgi:hypothetical protein
MDLVLLITILLAATIAAVFVTNSFYQTIRTGLPYVASSRWVIDWLTANLKLGSQDVFYELGCGDGRVVTAIGQKFTATKCIGIEIQWWPYLLARWRTRKLSNVTIIHGDIFKQNIGDATVVYGYYISGFAKWLADLLRSQLKPDTKVISYGFHFPDWPVTQEIPNPKSTRGSKLLIYQR